jgi:dihydrofolate reductase
MPKLKVDISMSLDGFVAGPNPTLEDPLGEGGERLHEWVLAVQGWRRMHGLTGGETNVDNDVVEEGLRNTGATVMGRRMFSGGEGPWEDDPNADAWWGDDPPFHHPVFVLTHHAREPVNKEGGTTFTFVTDGIESALEQARAAAGDKDVAVGGGANVAHGRHAPQVPRGQVSLEGGLSRYGAFGLIPGSGAGWSSWTPCSRCGGSGSGPSNSFGGSGMSLSGGSRSPAPARRRRSAL